MFYQTPVTSIEQHKIVYSDICKTSKDNYDRYIQEIKDILSQHIIDDISNIMPDKITHRHND